MVASKFPFYGLSVFGLFGTLLMLCYSAKRGACLGALAMLFNIFMIICAGGVLQDTGSKLAGCFESGDNVTNCFGNHGANVGGIKTYIQAEFAGAFLYTIFMTMAMVIFFYKAHSTDYNNLA
jgi:hypothetical protein